MGGGGHPEPPPEPQATPTGYSPEGNSTMGDSTRARRERRVPEGGGEGGLSTVPAGGFRPA